MDVLCKKAQKKKKHGLDEIKVPHHDDIHTLTCSLELHKSKEELTSLFIYLKKGARSRLSSHFSKKVDANKMPETRSFINKMLGER